MAGTINVFETLVPHGYSYEWRSDILWLNVLSDAVIAVTCISIALSLSYFQRMNPDAPLPGVIKVFCVFIFVCGLTHIFNIWTIWSGHLLLQGLFKALTALTAVTTACMLWPAAPKLFSLRSPRELEQTNLALQEQIDQRKLTEIQFAKLQDELARTGRVTTMGKMATGLAHELNQPLVAISASANTAVLLAEEANNNPELYECLDDIQSETRRAGDIIRALRQFMSKKDQGRVSVDINKLVQQTVLLLHREARVNDIEIIVDAASTPTVHADRVQLAQVLINLMRNAIEAISLVDKTDNESGKITVQTRFLDQKVIVTVRDSGPGLDSGVEPFIPFETSKIDGMGMGLSISNDIIEAHSGHLRLIENGSSGAVFMFSLPAGD